METLREQNIHENKKALRARCREIVKDLSPEYIEEASHKIASLVLATDAYSDAETIFCYMSMGGEPVTDEIYRASSRGWKARWDSALRRTT